MVAQKHGASITRRQLSVFFDAEVHAKFAVSPFKRLMSWPSARVWPCPVKVKFHYAIWFEAGSNLVASNQIA